MTIKTKSAYIYIYTHTYIYMCVARGNDLKNSTTLQDEKTKT